MCVQVHVCLYEQDLVLNNPQGLMSSKHQNIEQSKKERHKKKLSLEHMNWGFFN